MNTEFYIPTIHVVKDGVSIELLVKTCIDAVLIDEHTKLSDKLVEMVNAINNKAKREDVTAEIEAAINKLIGGAPETYDTLKEISEYISEHEDFIKALNAIIDGKVNQEDLDTLDEAMNTLKSTVEGFGKLANKDRISESDLDDALVYKLNTVSEGNHYHPNIDVLNGVTAEKVAEWDKKITVSATQPENMTAGDVWFQIIE